LTKEKPIPGFSPGRNGGIAAEELEVLVKRYGAHNILYFDPTEGFIIPGKSYREGIRLFFREIANSLKLATKNCRHWPVICMNAWVQWCMLHGCMEGMKKINALFFIVPSFNRLYRVRKFRSSPKASNNIRRMHFNRHQPPAADNDNSSLILFYRHTPLLRSHPLKSRGKHAF